MKNKRIDVRSARTPRMSPTKTLAAIDVRASGLKPLIGGTGERTNYNLQPGVTEYQLWPFSTIEWVVKETKYRARAIIQNKKTRALVAFNSWHQDFNDAESAIALLSDSLNGIGDRRVYNIFGETSEVHTADIGGGVPVTVTEVLALIWSMQQA
jgi:hypothetical protein